MKPIALLAPTFAVTEAQAGAYTSRSVPTRVDVVSGSGFMVYGSFGNANGCTTGDQFFVLQSHPQYNQIYATVMMAIASGRNIMAYADGCNSQAWYAGSTVTFNTVAADDAVSIQ